MFLPLNHFHFLGFVGWTFLNIFWICRCVTSSEEAFRHEFRMGCTILGKGDVSWSFGHFELSFRLFELNRIWAIFHRSRRLVWILREQSSVHFWYGPSLRCPGQTLIDVISWQISTWPLSFSHVEVLLHSFMASLFIFVILIKEPVLWLRVIFHALIG